jgi:hypothetical protein
MAYLLRTLLVIMLLAILLTALAGLEIIPFPIGHIKLAIISFIYMIFSQAFIMFYFIGVSRLTTNIYNVINSKTNLHQIFDEVPEDLTPYLKKTTQFVRDSDLCKRQTIPWTMMMLLLGMLAFFLGGAHDTGLVQKTTHSGVVYGMIAAMLIGFFRQWKFLKKAHLLLRKIKHLYSIPDGSM